MEKQSVRQAFAREFRISFNVHLARDLSEIVIILWIVDAKVNTETCAQSPHMADDTKLCRICDFEE